jgi:Family of unknown function (DUF6454)
VERHVQALGFGEAGRGGGGGGSGLASCHALFTVAPFSGGHACAILESARAQPVFTKGGAMFKAPVVGAVGVLVGSLVLLPASAPARSNPQDDPIVTALSNVTRATSWEHVDTIDLQFDAKHPQGMVKIGDRFFVSSVEIIEPTVPCPVPCDGYDRTPGRGVGHLYVIDGTGALLADLRLGEGHMYHPGGIDYDGRWLWVPVAEYRPNSNAIIYRVDPTSLAVGEAFRVTDHVGGVVRDRVDGHIHGVSWGSRTLYEWTARGRELARAANESHFIDYQDCDYLAFRKMMCGGIANLTAPGGAIFELGGLALVDLVTSEILHEVPVQRYSPVTKHVITRNPVFLEMTDRGLRLYTAPDDDEDAAILIHEATL